MLPHVHTDNLASFWTTSLRSGVPRKHQYHYCDKQLTLKTDPSNFISWCSHTATPIILASFWTTSLRMGLFLSFCSSLMFPHCETRRLALEWLSPSWTKRVAACRLWWRIAGWQRRPGRRRRPTGSWRPGWRPAGCDPCCSCRTAGRRSNHLAKKSGFRYWYTYSLNQEHKMNSSEYLTVRHMYDIPVQERIRVKVPNDYRKWNVEFFKVNPIIFVVLLFGLIILLLLLSRYYKKRF